MKRISNWDNITPANNGGSGRLPVGGYVGIIVGAKEVIYKQGTADEYSRLEIALDVSEGEYSGFFKDKFDNDQSENKKWKGVYRTYVPKDDGSEKDNKTKSIFKGVITSIEESNKGYKWDWNESGLKDKEVGFLVRDKQFLNDKGEVITFSEIFMLLSSRAVREHDYQDPKPKLLEDSQQINTAYAPADFNMAGLTPPPENNGGNGTSDYPF